MILSEPDDTHLTVFNPDEELLDLRYNLASVLEAEGRYDDAISAYQECYAVDIKFRDVSERLEKLFEKVGDEAAGGDEGYGGDSFYYFDDNGEG